MVKAICHNLMYIEKNKRRVLENMKNKVNKTIIIIIIILLLLFFAIITLLKKQLDKIDGVNSFINKNQNTLVEDDFEDDFEDDEEPAIDDDMEGEFLEDINSETKIDRSQMPAETETEGSRDVLYQESPREVTSSIYYNTVKNILQIFLQDLGTMSTKKYLNKTEWYIISNSDLRKKAYDRLSENYIKQNDIDVNNISEKMRISYSEFTVNIEKMMQYAIKENNILRFSVRLNIKDDEDSTKANNFIVYLDYENQSYAIEPVGNGKIEDVKLDSDIKSIEKNANNIYSYLDEE